MTKFVLAENNEQLTKNWALELEDFLNNEEEPSLTKKIVDDYLEMMHKLKIPFKRILNRLDSLANDAFDQFTEVLQDSPGKLTDKEYHSILSYALQSKPDTTKKIICLIQSCTDDRKLSAVIKFLFKIALEENLPLSGKNNRFSSEVVKNAKLILEGFTIAPERIFYATARRLTSDNLSPDKLHFLTKLISKFEPNHLSSLLDSRYSAVRKEAEIVLEDEFRENPNAKIIVEIAKMSVSSNQKTICRSSKHSLKCF
ncbi:MAG: hypothetical protein R3A13_03110 [Bdellovibrionota bacterium]